jgi:hypothetical protein
MNKHFISALVLLALLLPTVPVKATFGEPTSCTCNVDGFETECPLIDTTGYPQADCGYLVSNGATLYAFGPGPQLGPAGL